MSDRDHYEVLGLTPAADGSTVNRTYWQLARKYQALAPSDPRAHGMLDELNEAYNVLGTPALRDAYDAKRLTADAPPEGQGERLAGTAPPRSWRAPEPGRAEAHASGRGMPKSWLVYGCGAALAAAGAAAGVLTGNLILDVLAGSGVLALGVAATRGGTIASRRARSASSGAPDAPAPSLSRSQTKSRTPGEPLSASIVRNRSASADDVRTSTASMVGRWRTKVNTTPAPSGPDLTLVDIFRSEEEIETQSEPLTAVLDVLRGSRKPVESR